MLNYILIVCFVLCIVLYFIRKKMQEQDVNSGTQEIKKACYEAAKSIERIPESVSPAESDLLFSTSITSLIQTLSQNYGFAVGAESFAGHYLHAIDGDDFEYVGEVKKAIIDTLKGDLTQSQKARVVLRFLTVPPSQKYEWNG